MAKRVFDVEDVSGFVTFHGGFPVSYDVEAFLAIGDFAVCVRVFFLFAYTLPLGNSVIC